jgi:DNA-binding MarR family transcriptional regulator
VAKSELGMRAWSHFLGAQALALRAIEEQLRAAGQPSMAWYDVLLELERAGGRLRQGDLAERLVVERYNITRMLDRMEAAGLVRREQVESDRRGIMAVLTEAGREQRQAAWPHYQKAITENFAEVLSESEAAALTEVLKKLISHLRRQR